MSGDAVSRQADGHAGGPFECGIPEIEIDDLERLQTAGSAVFDVRESWEYQEAHIPGAVSVPLDSIVGASDRFRAASVEGPLYMVCAMGGRSAQAVDYLRSCGIDAVNVAGGTDAWLEAGKPVDTGP